MITRYDDLPDFDDDQIWVREETASPQPFPRKAQSRWQVWITRSLVGGVVHARRNSRGPWLVGADIPKVVRDYVLANDRGRIVLNTGSDPETWEGYVALWNGGYGPEKRQRVARGLKGVILIEEWTHGKSVPGVRVGISFSEPLDGGVDDFLPFPFSEKTFRETVQGLIDTEKDLRAENGIFDDVKCPGCGEEGVEKDPEAEGYQCMNRCGKTFPAEEVFR